MVLKTTGLSSRFQRKNRLWKICTGSRNIDQNVPKFVGLVWRPDFWHILLNISGLGEYFSKPIFALKPWAQAGRFKYHEPYKRNNFFFSYKGGCRFLKSRTPQLKPLKIEKTIFFVLPTFFWPTNLPEPLHKSKFFVPFMGFMVLKTTGLSSRFQRKKRFWKKRIGSRDIGQKVSK